MQDLDKCTVMIVDDDEANIDILVETLSDEYEISVALDGPTALEHINEYPPDLILLDISMPNMNGYEVCSILRGNDATREIPIIFITAKDDVQDETHCFEMGAVDYIHKPVNPLIVLARVKTQLTLLNQHRALKKNYTQLQEMETLRDKLVNIRSLDIDRF